MGGGPISRGVVGVPTRVPKPGTVFVYSGQGSQWAGMGRQLLADEPAFAEALAEIEPVFVEQVGFSLREIIEGGSPAWMLTEQQRASQQLERIERRLIALETKLSEARLIKSDAQQSAVPRRSGTAEGGTRSNGSRRWFS